MRIAAHVDQVFFDIPGGVGTYVRNLIPALAARDPSLEIRLFHARFEPAPEPEPWMAAFPVEEIPASIRSLYPRWNILGRPALPAPIRSAELVHATSASAVPPAGERRLVVTVHDLAFERYPGMFPRTWRAMYRTGLRAAVRRAHAILTPSRHTAEDVLSRTKVDPAKLYVVPLAAASPARVVEVADALRRLKVRAPYILFVGTIEPRKNLVRLVRAYRRVAATGLPHALVLAGALGWQHEALMRELALEGPGEIVMTGALDPGDLDAVLRAADAFVYPSLYEGFGLPVLEAMTRGVPAIVSNTSSLPEVTGDAVLGVNPRSIREIAAAIETLCADVDLAERLAAAGRLRAERFSWDETARRTLEVYERALDTK